jgi:hypothetical protein
VIWTSKRLVQAGVTSGFYVGMRNWNCHGMSTFIHDRSHMQRVPSTLYIICTPPNLESFAMMLACGRTRIGCIQLASR